MAKITDLEEVKKIEKLKKDVRDAAEKVLQQAETERILTAGDIAKQQARFAESNASIYYKPMDIEQRSLSRPTRSTKMSEAIKKLDAARDALQIAMEEKTKTRSPRRLSTETTSARRAGMLAGLAVITGVLSILFPPLLLVSGLFAIGAGYYGAKYAGGVAGRSMGRGWANAGQGFSYDPEKYSSLSPQDIKNAVNFAAGLQAAPPNSQPTSAAKQPTTTPSVTKPATPPPPPPPPQPSQGPIEVVITSNHSDYIAQQYSDYFHGKNDNEVTLKFKNESDMKSCFQELAQNGMTFLASTPKNDAIAACKNHALVYKGGTDYPTKSTEVTRALVNSSNLNQGNPPSRTNNSTSTPNPTPNHNP